MPDGWRDVNLADITSLIRNGFSCNQDKNGFGSPVTRIETISDGTINYERVGFTNAPIDNSYRLKSGDILFSHINSVKHIGKVAIYDDTYPLYHGMNLMLIRCQQSCVNPLYLYYILSDRRAKAYFENHCKQAINQASLNRRDISQFQFTLPPLPEQKKIAAILGSVDDAIQVTQVVIDQTRRVKQGLLQQLLTRGIGHTRFKQTEIGEIPQEWLEGTFGDYLKEIKGGGTPSRKKPTYWRGTIPWASVKDLNGVCLRNTEEYITQEGLNNSASNLIPAGTVIIATRMALGKVVRFSCDVAINQDLKALFPKKELSSDYLFYWLLLQASLIEALGAGSTVKGIRLESLRALKLILPPIEEQMKIVAILTGVDKGLNIEQDKMFQLHKIKKGLMQDLLTGRVRVKLDEMNTT